MPVPRRSLLALLAAAPVLPLAACAPSPVIVGAPSAPFSPTPTEPAQSPAALAAATWSVGLRNLAVSPLAPAAWQDAVVAASTAHLARLLAADPLIGGTEPVFKEPAAKVAAPADASQFDTALSAHLADGVALFTGLVSAADSQPLRLLYASLAGFARGVGAKAAPPVDSGAAPIRFPDTTVNASLGVALTHVWALIQGLELGLARLPKSDVRTMLSARLDQARELRNDLRDAITGDLPVQAIDYEMPNAMSTPDEVRAGMALLELALLAGLARVVASGSGGDAWLTRMTDQVDAAQSWGAAVDYWPGWVDVA